jgi:hypothetical protein
MAVTLTATPNENATFSGWSGAGCSGTGTCMLTLDADKAVTASFTVKETGSLDWQKLYGSSSNWDIGRSTAFDSAGNVMFAGDFRDSTIDFGGGPLTTVGVQDIFVAKYSGTGAYQWARRFGGDSGDWGHAAGMNAAGDVYLAGLMGSQFSVGGGLLPCTQGALLAKYASANGAHLWSFCVTGANNYPPIIQSLQVDANGDVYIAGMPTGGDFGGGTLNGTLFVAKFSGTDGKHLWSKTFGSSLNGASTWLAVLALDGSGNLLLSGTFYGTLQIGTASLSSVGEGDIFVAKLNPAGSHLWSKSFGDSREDRGEGVAVDAAGDVLLTGAFKGTVDLGGGPLTSAGDTDIFLVKLTGGDGSHQWSKRFGGGAADQGLDVAAGPNNGVVMAGSFASPTLNLGTGSLTNQGSTDTFVAKYSATGTPVWSTTAGSSNLDDSAHAIAVNTQGAVAVTGKSTYKLLMMKLAP